MTSKYAPDPDGTTAQRELYLHMKLVEGRRDHWEDVHRGVDFDQLVPAPPIVWTADLLGLCEEAFQMQVAGAGATLITRDLLRGVPVWVFLQYLTNQQQLLVHGSNQDDIAEFTPRTAGDTYAGGEIPKVYAASSPILALFFAVLDKRRLWELPCVPAVKALYIPRNVGGRRLERFWFVVDHRALPHAPWRSGMIYILPRGSFEPDACEMQWYSTEPVRPLARIAVGPADFPLLQEVRGIDWFEDAKRELVGVPFKDDLELYPPVPRP